MSELFAKIILCLSGGFIHALMPTVLICMYFGHLGDEPENRLIQAITLGITWLIAASSIYFIVQKWLIKK